MLEKLDLPSSLKKLSCQELEQLAGEIRARIIKVVSENGGHLSSNLGSVEIAIALHTVYDSPSDKIIWDVGHQAYAHKILTGRNLAMDSLRQHGGVSGYPNPEESPHDVFFTGHAGTSISTALGLAAARDMKGDPYNVVAVIGDGSLSGGVSLEAVNNALHLNSNLVVVLNDNEMSISKNVGGLSEYFTGIRMNPLYTGTKDRVEKMVKRIPNIGVPLFKLAEKMKNRLKNFIIDFKTEVIVEELGFRYLGPIDGHNTTLLMSALSFAKEAKGPILLHVLTKKGKGYPPAEKDPTKYHGAQPFDIVTGQFRSEPARTYSDVFGGSMTDLARTDDRIVAVTAAMVDGTGLEEFAKKYPSRFFDVGIAEEHAVVFAAGLAKGGMKPVVAIYSTFLQRSYDEIFHDVCLQGLPVVFCLDRAGIVGDDGPTHNGVFDLAYLRHLPGMVLMAPKDENELRDMLYTALKHNGPIAVRYPRSKVHGAETNGDPKRLELGKGEVVFRTGAKEQKQKHVLFVGIGSMVGPCAEAAAKLGAEGISSAVINARFVKPLDGELITEEAGRADLVVTVEEGCLQGGFGSAVLELFEEEGISIPVKRIGLPDRYIEAGKRDLILDRYGLSAGRIYENVRSALK